MHTFKIMFMNMFGALSTHTPTYYSAYTHNCPLQLLHSDDYFQHNKIWGCSGSKSWSPLVYFCDGILIHSQRLRIAVA